MKHYNSTQSDFIMHYIIISLSMHETLQQYTSRFYNALRNYITLYSLYMKQNKNTKPDFVMLTVISPPPPPNPTTHQ